MAREIEKELYHQVKLCKSDNEVVLVGLILLNEGVQSLVVSAKFGGIPLGLTSKRAKKGFPNLSKTWLISVYSSFD